MHKNDTHQGSAGSATGVFGVQVTVQTAKTGLGLAREQCRPDTGILFFSPRIILA